MTGVGTNAAAEVSVEAIVAFGANLGDRAGTIASAARSLADADGVELIAISPIYESVAVTLDGADPDAPPYLNGVFRLATTLTPRELLAVLHRIEDALGRTREVRWGSRTLDLDLIVHGAARSDDPAVTLPHPRAWERVFVLQPWLDVDPHAELPGRGQVRALLDAIGERLDVYVPNPVGTP